MDKEKIAILVDSGTDIPREYIEKYKIYVLPLMLIYKEKEYHDGIDITASEVISRFDEEIPTTSLPSPAYTLDVLKKIKADGYEKVIAVMISSGLSNTANMVRVVAGDIKDLLIHVVDTKNIGIGSGFSGILAAELINLGKTFDEIVKIVEDGVKNSKLYFCLDTLEYLYKGGRIGLVSAIFGKALNLKPIISCNEDGVYYAAAKARGRKKSLRTAMDMAINFAKGSERYNLTVMHAGAEAEAKEIAGELKQALPKYNIFVDGQITPSLIVHTGPGLIGIGVQKISY